VDFTNEEKPLFVFSRRISFIVSSALINLAKQFAKSNKTGSEKLNVLISKRDAQGNLRRLRKRM
jgi:hypothetical protein